MDPAVSERKCDVRGMMTSSSGGQAHDVPSTVGMDP